MHKWFVALVGVFSLVGVFGHEQKEPDEIKTYNNTTYNKLVIDPYFSPYMGAEDIYTAFDTLSRLEDKRIPALRKHPKKISAMLIRLIEDSLWINLGRYMGIWQHEYFGHGFRIRSLGRDKFMITGYENDLFSGSTQFCVDDSKATLSDLLSIDIAGLESEGIMARTIANKWVEKEELNSRLGGLYIESALSSWLYASNSIKGTLPTKDNFLSEGNDILAYVFDINNLYPSANLTVRKVSEHLSCNILDPMLWYSFYAEIKYIIVGTTMKVPMFSFDIKGNNLKFLPAFRARLTPYGIENDVVGYFKWNNMPITIDMRWGNLAQFTFGGVHVNMPTLVEVAGSNFGLEVDMWKQPNFEVSPTLLEFVDGVNTPLPSKSRYGGAILLNATLNLTDSKKTLPYVKIGYKSQGYYPGYILDAGWIGRVGIATKF
ncbi:hypothetical protein COB21_01570 [Candidatus Aerophobetes bacterium]|uniref:Uncharacterized protein n=1 Tax=Aerophobetes bacterium TaxID=2030807 RepID=A0A2A4X6F2_UNCAE|nr:MAG: hypothetical protein COB21_01570 [Candidatus Aerophobetes bacterium]